jgi:homoserine kinase type II
VDYLQLLKQWNLEFSKVRDDIPLTGSPDRTKFRIAVEDVNGKIYVLEHIEDALHGRKMSICKTLEYLHKNGLEEVNPYLHNTVGGHIIYGEGYWQIQEFVDGWPLKRPEYLNDEWRGPALANFLLDLKIAGKDCPINRIPFSLKNYVYDTKKKIDRYDPEIVARVNPIIEFLEEGFMDVYDDLPTGFCHGDYHQINVIWSKDSVKKVIDWEFVGHKMELYDAINMVGCLGMENPYALTGDLVKGFISKLKRDEFGSKISWDWFLESLVAQRFAWLSDWLAKFEEDMIELELTYMHLLMKNKELLKQEWNELKPSSTKVDLSELRQ